MSSQLVNIIELAGSTLLFIVAFACDWIRLRTMKALADESGVIGISANPFVGSNGKSFKQVRKNIPSGPIRTKVRFLEVLSALCWIALVTTNVLALCKKYSL